MAAAEFTVEIVKWSPAWAEEFQARGALLRAALGGRAVRIDHIGSTSVPGLAAKPIVDSCPTVADSADEAASLGDLQAAG